jgi:hypothetical protein
MHVTVAAWAGAVVFSFVLPGLAAAQPSFVEVAREFTGGLMWLDADVRPSLAEDGTVAFAGSDELSQLESTHVFAGDGGPLVALDFDAAGLSNPTSVENDDAGHVAIAATRLDGVETWRGAYVTTESSGVFSTVLEGREGPLDPGESPPVQPNVAMAGDGTLAFSTIRNGEGALYRAPFGGALTSLREGSGTFFNTRRLDVNESGVVAVQMEYGDPTAGLSRGILLFDTPMQTLDEVDTAIERTSVGVQPSPAINASGQVAFTLNTTVTMVFFDPPGVPGTVLEEVTLEPGVYVSTPAPWGTPKHPTLIAGVADGYDSFGDVDLNDAGEVAFEASAGGEFGVFVGPDPVADKVLATGDTMGPLLFSLVRLGEINNAGEIELLTSDFRSTDRQVWRVDDAVEPPPPPPPHHHSWLRKLVRSLIAFLFRLGHGGHG